MQQQYNIDLTNIPEKNIYNLSPDFSGKTPDGETLSFTNYYMEINQSPFFGVSGEIHYARMWEERWEDALLKMKSGGINIISTYVFWIHHEEEEGVFDFSGRRDLRRFVSLCQKHGLYVIVRIGPFSHGEARNGGLPDWLYGKPFEVRELNDGFINCVRKLYSRLASELNGLYYKDGGPIIAAQLDNEYMHSAAPWEITTGISNEWIASGSDGDKYMLKLRDIAEETGIIVPFYTCTGWGGAATPEKLMPLWGGYAFRPWIFYSHKGEHPATEEYIYRDNHNNAVTKTYNFEPFYKPESKPYLCCEMGGGMTCCYYYRFQLPYESVDAMANIKMGSGCNMLGYYMYHGGTNPKSKRGVFLNEGQVPKLSYDYQAALGEYGQIRDSYRRLKALHLLSSTFSGVLCRTKTVLPDGSQDILPEDTDTLRYAVRLTEDGAGFLFINNYQDHTEMKKVRNKTIELSMPDEKIRFENLSMDAGENCILPFNLTIGGIKLRSASAQPLTVMETNNGVYAFFFAPSGMVPVYHFPIGTKISGDTGKCNIGQKDYVTVTAKTGLPLFTATQNEKSVCFVTLTREESLEFYIIKCNDQAVAVITKGALMLHGGCLRVEHNENSVNLAVFPDGVLPINGALREADSGFFTRYILKHKPVKIEPKMQQVGSTRFIVNIPQYDEKAVKDVILQIDYNGDIGHAFVDGDMIADNFSNGSVWEIGLKEFMPRLSQNPVTIYITPQKDGCNVNVESVMAGRKEETLAITGQIKGIATNTVYEWKL